MSVHLFIHPANHIVPFGCPHRRSTECPPPQPLCSRSTTYSRPYPPLWSAVAPGGRQVSARRRVPLKELRKTHFRDATAEVVVVVIVSVARRIVNLYIVSDRLLLVGTLPHSRTTVDQQQSFDLVGLYDRICRSTWITFFLNSTVATWTKFEKSTINSVVCYRDFLKADDNWWWNARWDIHASSAH